MPRASLRVTFPDSVWIGAVSREFPEAQFRVISAIPSGAIGVALVEVAAPNPDTVAAAMEARDDVQELNELESQPEFSLVQLETTLPLLLDAARESGVPLQLPLKIQDGEARWEVTASRDRVSDLGSSLEAFGLSFSVESIYQEVDSQQILTDQQWELVQSAVEMGYYDTPRECTQYELADALDMARSTCSETLHRAEGRIISRFVAETGNTYQHSPPN